MLKDFLILNTNSVMSFTRFASGEKFSLYFVFKHSYIEGITSDYDNFDYFLKLKVKNVANPGLSRIFKDRGNPALSFSANVNIYVYVSDCFVLCALSVYFYVHYMPLN